MQLVRSSLLFGIRRFIVVFTEARHSSVMNRLDVVYTLFYFNGVIPSRSKSVGSFFSWNLLVNISSPSSSSGATTSIFECFDLLSIWFPIITILDAANPILYFQLLHLIPYVIFPSVLWSRLWSYWHRFSLIYFLPFSLPPFDVNGQPSLIVVLLCDLLYSYVLLIHLIHRLFDSPFTISFFCRTKDLSQHFHFKFH